MPAQRYLVASRGGDPVAAGVVAGIIWIESRDDHDAGENSHVR
jgi:hypothetical protein